MTPAELLMLAIGGDPKAAAELGRMLDSLTQSGGAPGYLTEYTGRERIAASTVRKRGAGLLTLLLDSGQATLTATGDASLPAAADSIANSQLADMAQSTIKGRAAGAGTGDPTDLTAAQVRTIIGAREKLTAPRTYYVRTDGSDLNDGLTNSSGGAFLTTQKAIDTASDTLDAGVHNIIIQHANGTYSTSAGNTLKQCIGSGTVTIRGDVTTPSNVVITTTGNGAQTFIYPRNSTTIYVIEGVKLTASGTTPIAMAAQFGSVIYFNNVEFSTGFYAHLFGSYRGKVICNGNYSITSGAVIHALSDVCGELNISSFTITLTGTPAFSGAFAYAQELASLRATGITFTGSATGTRYTVALNAVIQTGGGGPNYFPGDVPGAFASGGQYL